MLRLFTGENSVNHRRSANLEAALLITTYQKPRHLRLVLASVAMQEDVEGKLEVVVVDDGSTDETFEVVRQFAERVDFPVRFTTHRRRAFQVARCRNEGALASKAPYLIYLDGDCIVRSDFVAQHLRYRKRRIVLNGDCFRLDEDVSARIDERVLRSGEYGRWVSDSERLRIYKSHRRSRINNLLMHPTKPHLIGNNVGVWRTDFESINGFDEAFEGWGGEDDDIGYRLRQAGIRIRSIRMATPTYHIWHPREATYTPDWRDGLNFDRLMRANRETRCRNGLVKLDLDMPLQEGLRLYHGADETQIVDFSSENPIAETRPESRILKIAA